MCSFLGDGEDSGDECSVFGLAVGGEAVERPDGGKPSVSAADTVVALVFEVLQERADELGVEVGEVELARLFPGLFRRSRGGAGMRRGRRRWCERWLGADR